MNKKKKLGIKIIILIILSILIIEFTSFKVFLGIMAGVILIKLIHVKKRKYFWKDREGNKLTFKQFLKRFKQGVSGISPLQQTKTTLWSMIPIFGGLLWGATATFFLGTYWLTLILTASLPITTMQFISTLQKYWNFKKIEQAQKEAEQNVN